MKRFSFFSLLLLAFLAALSLASCKTTGTAASGQGESASQATKKSAATNPEADLGQKMFLLPDGRDMSYSVVRVMRLGVDDASVRKAAQELVFSDFKALLDGAAQAHRVVYLGGGKIRVDALQFYLGEESFSEAVFVLHLTRFVADGKTIDGIILDSVSLDGTDYTTYAALRVYELMLTHKAGL